MGRLTTHVLDTASGRPGAGIAFSLFRLDAERQLICSGETNSDGRSDEPLLAGGEFSFGTYELDFKVGSYFAASSVPVDDPPFLDDITIRFSISADQHYHVPLLVSPWSYSTYRGS